MMMMTVMLMLTERLMLMKMMLLAPLVMVRLLPPELVMMLRLSASLWAVRMMSHFASSALGKADSGRQGTPQSESCGCDC